MLFNIAIFLCAMPYLGPSGLLPTDIQPYAVTAAVLAILVRPKFSLAAVHVTILPVISISIFAAISAFWLIFTSEDHVFPILRSLWGYLTQSIILVFVWIYRREMTSSKRVTRILDICMLIIFSGFILQAFGLNNIIQALTSRAVFSYEALSARGFTSFHPEQSRVSEQMLLFGIIYLMLNELTIKRTFLLFAFGFMSFAGQFLVSFLQIIFAFLAVIAIAIVTSGVLVRVRNFAFSFLGLLVLLFGYNFLAEIFQLASDLGLPDRFTVALNRLSQSPFALLEDKNAQIKFSGFIYALAAPVGDPGIFDVLAYSRQQFGEKVYPIGNGFIKLFADVHLAKPSRPYTAIGQWSIHFGVLGLLFVFFFFTFVFGTVWKVRDRGERLKFLFIFFVLAQLMFLKLPLSNPALWLATGILIVTAAGGGCSERKFIRRPHGGTLTLQGASLRASNTAAKRESWT